MIKHFYGAEGALGPHPLDLQTVLGTPYLGGTLTPPPVPTGTTRESQASPSMLLNTSVHAVRVDLSVKCAVRFLVGSQSLASFSISVQIGVLQPSHSEAYENGRHQTELVRKNSQSKQLRRMCDWEITPEQMEIFRARRGIVAVLTGTGRRCRCCPVTLSEP